MADNLLTVPGEPPAVAELSNAATASASGATEQTIDPWSANAGVDEQGNALSFDYVAISKKWNTQLIDAPLLERFERLTGRKPHRWLRRGLFFSHRDLDRILTHYEKGETFLLYTGRGPSGGSLHIGHTIPFEFTKWLQDVFDMPLVIMLTDDEKYLFQDKLTVEEVLRYAENNARDIIAMGFDPKKTFIFTDFNYMGGHFYQNAIEFARLLPTNQVRGAFGFDGSTNIGRVFFPAVQCVAAFATSFPEIWGQTAATPRDPKVASIPCLIPCAIDQDPYFRLLRDNSGRMRHPVPKAALIHSKFVTALQGPGGKMSSSDPTSAIFMSDSANDIKKKVNKYAFSGGRETQEEHRRLGGNPDVDVPFQYLTYFLEDDTELENIRQAYVKGELLTGEMKKKCIDVMSEYVGGFQERRAKVDADVVRQFTKPRKLEFSGNPNPNPHVTQKPSPLSNSKRASALTIDGASDGPREEYESQPPTPTSMSGMPSLSRTKSSVQNVGSTQHGHIVQRATLDYPEYELDDEDGTSGDGSGAESSGDAPQYESLKPAPKRPGMGSQRRSAYGVRGLSDYGSAAVDMIYEDGGED